MNMHLGGRVLTQKEMTEILEQALTILETIGVTVENQSLLKYLDEGGGSVDYRQMRVFFSRRYVMDFLQESEKIQWEDKTVSFGASAEIYQGKYLDPRDGGYKPWTRERLKEYALVARNLPEIDRVTMLGYPVGDVPVLLQPLYEKIFCWKYGIEGGTAIWQTDLCGKILEMFQAYAQEQNRPLKEVFNCGVFLISPLKFAATEAEQYLYFYEKGLAVTVGTLGSLGGTAPVTAAGALSLHLAENLFINILQRIFWGAKKLEFGNSLSCLDMASGNFQYGRPEQVLLNIAGAQIAEYLGASYVGHGGLSDAKVPGNESAAQKLISAVFNGVTSGYGHISAGLLSVDEVFSPVQMILDNEAMGSLRYIARGMTVDEENLALETIEGVGPGGNFLGTEHTAVNFRESFWWPALWSDCMFQKWDSSGRKTDVDKAREKFFSIVQDAEPLPPQISPELERELLQIIEK